MLGVERKPGLCAPEGILETTLLDALALVALAVDRLQVGGVVCPPILDTHDVVYLMRRQQCARCFAVFALAEVAVALENIQPQALPVAPVGVGELDCIGCHVCEGACYLWHCNARGGPLKDSY